MKKQNLALIIIFFYFSGYSQLPFPLPSLVDTTQFGKNIQRTMKLLSTSTSVKRNTVKIMVYGQSIAKQEWSDSVRLFLKKKYPFANLQMINRSIGGCWAGCLVDYMAYDIKTFYPDLILFDVYGWNEWGEDQGPEYESILNYIRSNTTAEIGMQNHHVTGTETRNVNSGGARYFSELALKYGIELIDIRTRWLSYLINNNVTVANDLTTDGTHLNNWGNFLMARLYRPYLNYNSSWISDPNGLVTIFKVGTDVFPVNGKITLPFNGNKVNIVHANPVANMDSAAVFIDNKRPSTMVGNVMFTRPNDGYDTIFRHYPAIDFPWQAGTISKFETPTSLLKAQDWTLTFLTYNAGSNFTYRVSGSKTGNDGNGSSNINSSFGTSGADFNSTSGQVRFLNGKFNFNNGPYSPLPLGIGYTIKWKAKAFYTDTFIPSTLSGGAIDSVSVIAQGISNDNHTLIIDAKGNKNTPIKEIHIYRPFFNRTNPNFTITAPNLVITNPSATCTGTFIDLSKTFVDSKSITGIVTYWTNASATISITSPNLISIAGTYYIKKQAIIAGLFDIKPVVVPVFSTCNPNLVITNPAASCIGSTVNITSTFIDANAVVGTVTYWKNASATITLSNPTNATVPGLYYIKKISNANGSFDIKAVTLTSINCQPNLVITNPAAICSGNSVNITNSFTDINSVTGTISYWTNATATTTLIGENAVTLSGTYYIKKTHISGISDTKPINITVNSLPNISITSPSNICSGNIATLTASGTNTYLWLPNSIVGSTISVSPLSNTTYTVLGTSSQNCSKLATFNHTVLSLPTLNIIGATSICTGNITTITCTGANTYSWLPTNQSGNIQTFNPSANTNYTVIGTALNGCFSKRIFNISVSSLPSISVNGNKSICIGNTTILTASGTNSFVWMPGSIPGSTLLLNPNSTSTFTLTGSNNPTCFNTVFVTITVNSLPNILVNGNKTICNGKISNLTATGANNYIWLPSNSTGNILNFNPISNFNYTVIGTNTQGCTNSELFTITVNSLPNITINGLKEICINESTILTATGANSYTWLPNNILGNIQNFNPTLNTNYTVIGINSQNCENKNIFNISVNNLPNIVPASLGAVCDGSSAYLSVSGANTYSWQPGSLVGQNVNTILNNSVEFTVSGIDIKGCKNTGFITQIINPLPVVSVNGVKEICEGESVNIATTGAPFVLYQPGGFINFITKFAPTITTSYSVKSTSYEGCISYNYFTITVAGLPVLTTPTYSQKCIGEITNLTISGADSFQWMPGSLVGSNIFVELNESTDFTVTGTLMNGCKSSTIITQIINPNPILTIDGIKSICIGKSTNISVSGANTYTWLPNNLVGNTQNFNLSSNQDFTILGLDLNGCKNENIFTITVNSIPQFTINYPNTICSGFLATVSATGTNNYLWQPINYFGNIVQLNVTGFEEFTVIGTNNNNCESTQKFKIESLECNPNKISKFENTELLNVVVYPNPANDFIEIKSNNEILKSIIYDNQSKFLFETHSKNIDISQLNQGIYFIRIITINKKEKVIKLSVLK